VTSLRTHLETRTRARGKLLVPYVMAGFPTAGQWPRVLAALAPYSDAVEIGVPYSDPVMDGPVIADSGQRMLDAGTGPGDALALAARDAGVPKVVMTYYNPVHALGENEFCARLRRAGVSGLIVPDLPVEESSSLTTAARQHGLGWIPLVAPTSSPRRVAAVAATATGFVYAVSTLGVTGTRSSLSARAAEVAAACRAATDLPILVGIGVSTPEQAVDAAAAADGVVIGTAVVAALRDGGPDAAATFLFSVREALDAGR
jgi:tryptophan synthase alpha chain